MDEIDRFLKEDLGKKGDITSDALFVGQTARACIVAKEDCIAEAEVRHRGRKIEFLNVEVSTPS